MGRAARNAEGQVILYADKMTPAMDAAIRETQRRRDIQSKYNGENGIVPQTIVKPVHELLEISRAAEPTAKKNGVKMTRKERDAAVEKLEKQMKQAAKMMEFELAALLRDQIIELKKEN
jgi:excinuclease ABC subunit B